MSQNGDSGRPDESGAISARLGPLLAMRVISTPVICVHSGATRHKLCACFGELHQIIPNKVHGHRGGSGLGVGRHEATDALGEVTLGPICCEFTLYRLFGRQFSLKKNE
ncbi:hypothetical protein EVAR_35246_1 [Eumeta japonica]|uniref:Uncharacterized protein n=1 Tax=Eumeta variegata TaxID=151549 RepID=A0A4C1VCT1_EUMVA|nr:hypothetical protein EVAR_35246_1 [Eumeta japonica]